MNPLLTTVPIFVTYFISSRLWQTDNRELSAWQLLTRKVNVNVKTRWHTVTWRHYILRLLLWDSDSATTATSCLGVLASYTQTVHTHRHRDCWHVNYACYTGALRGHDPMKQTASVMVAIAPKAWHQQWVPLVVFSRHKNWTCPMHTGLLGTFNRNATNHG